MVQICTIIHVNLESQIPSLFLFPTHLGGGVDGPESVVGQRVELRAGVEGPGEGEAGVGRVGPDRAVDGGDLAVRHAVHHLLVVGAHRLVWGKKKKIDAFQGSVAMYMVMEKRSHEATSKGRNFEPVYVQLIWPDKCTLYVSCSTHRNL